MGGTSAAAPMWAAMIALANEQAAKQGKGLLGFLNPAIYKIASGSHYGSDFHDITPSNSGTAMMTLTASAGDSYAWTGPGGNPAGNTQSISAASAGTYSVLVTNASGCQGSASITLEAVLRVKP